MFLEKVSIKVCCVLGVLFSTSIALSQNAEKVYSISNPYGSSLRISSLTVDDSINFRVEPMKPLPFELPENGTLDFKVTVLRHDGITRTSQVRFGDDKNTSSYTIEIEAPITSSVKSSIQEMQSAVFPNPAKDYCIINVDITQYPNVEIELFNSTGASIIGGVQQVGKNLSLDVRNLASGNYHLLIKSNGNLVRKEEIIVSH